MGLQLLLLLLALACFTFAALGAHTRHVNLTAAGLAFVVLSMLV
jgi:hypothetical protein